MFGATNIKVLQKLCWRCPVVFCFRAGSLDVGDAPASYSSAQKFSWTPVHELLHGLSMLLDNCFIFPASIFDWVILPFHQVLEVLLPPGLLTQSLI
jgi:hypothetical protein